MPIIPTAIMMIATVVLIKRLVTVLNMMQLHPQAASHTSGANGLGLHYDGSVWPRKP
jgi:hypothetical protein